MSEPLQARIDELIGDIRRHACEADRKEAGCDLAVVLCQAEQMILHLQRRAPGPATEKMVADAKHDLPILRGLGNSRADLLAAFIAEHEPAKVEGGREDG